MMGQGRGRDAPSANMTTILGSGGGGGGVSADTELAATTEASSSLGESMIDGATERLGPVYAPAAARLMAPSAIAAAAARRRVDLMARVDLIL